MTNVVKVFNFTDKISVPEKSMRAVRQYRDGKVVREDIYEDKNNDGKFDTNERTKTTIFDVEQKAYNLYQPGSGKNIPAHLCAISYDDIDGDGNSDCVSFTYRQDSNGVYSMEYEDSTKKMPEALKYSEKDIVTEEYDNLKTPPVL